MVFAMNKTVAENVRTLCNPRSLRSMGHVHVRRSQGNSETTKFCNVPLRTQE